MSSRSTRNMIKRFAPHIYFHPKETCFPIPIDLYLKECEISSHSDPTYCAKATSRNMYQSYCNQIPNLYLRFTHNYWKSKLKGNPNNAHCYARAILTGYNCWTLVYFYVFSHTEPYKLCGCCCELNSWSHRADIKFIIVELENANIKRVYYGAHGTKAGEWRNASEIQIRDDTHPVAYSCLNDHSFYPKKGIYPRIFGCVYDDTYKGILSEPHPTEIVTINSVNFSPDRDGWVYFPGCFNQDGIGSPASQWWWNGIVSDESNNWWRRLFCYRFF